MPPAGPAQPLPNFPAAAPASTSAATTLPPNNTTAEAAPTSAHAATASGPPRPTRVSLVPRNGQSQDQEARDRYECYRFAVTQSGFDPLRWGSTANSASQDYERAQVACFDARGYTVR
jgi:hypothetical protein